MPYTVNYEVEACCITVAVHGELDLPLLRSIASDIAKIGKAEGCIHILNDLREANLTKGTIDVYNMPDIAKKFGIGQKCKRALVVGDKASDFYFLETVFLNRGYQVKMFADIDDARAWLLGE